VGRPSMGEGRTPGGVGAGGAIEGIEAAFDASSPAGARERAMLRLRNAILESFSAVSRDFSKLLEGLGIGR
jgi:hypothetical protein